MKLKRNISLDVVRIFALFCVISVHFFLNNGFYDSQIVGGRMLIMTIMRTFFMVCVPLFLVLSGYLMNGKTLSKKYYKGLNKTLLTYLGASICCLLFRILYLHEIISKRQWILGMFDFTNASYSWYIEMYIGLFLLIPFLNLIYNNLCTKKQKQVLVITFLALTAIPQVLNIFNLYASSFSDAFLGIDEYAKIFPNWWIDLFPITYYFIGCYLHEFKVSIRKHINILLLIASTLIFGCFNFYRSYNTLFVSGPYQTWGALPNVIMTTLVFIFIANLDLSRLSDKCKMFIAKLSSLCLGAYLLSLIFDEFFYEKLLVAVPQTQMRLEYYFLIVPLVFVSSLILSYIVETVISLCKKGISFSIKSIKR